MRILEVVPYFAPAYAYGGPPETVDRLCKALANRGHEVTVLTTDAFSSTARQATKHKTNGVDIYYLRNLSNYLAWYHQLFLPLGTRTFLRERASRFNIVHVHSFRTYQNVAVRHYALRARIPYVLAAHGSGPRIVRKRLVKALFDKLVGNEVLEDAAKFIAVSNAEATQYQAMGVPSSKIAVIPNGIEPKQYSNLPPRGMFSHRNGLDGKRLVTYLGRLNSRKGLDTLLRSARKLVDADNSITLVLAGPDDGYQGKIERMVRRLSLQDHVLLTGLITLPEKLGVLVDSDVVVYPGAFEIFGLVPFEALLCGRPVIVADDSGCGEIVKKAGGGLTFPPGNPDILRARIQQALDDPEALEPMIERGRNYVLEQMNWDRIAEQVEEVYRDAIDSAT